MFRSVKLKLTLINTAVVGIILFLFFSGIYILMKQNTERQSEQLLHAVANDVRMRSQRQDAPPQFRRFSNSFYVRYDANGNLLDHSDVIPVTDADMNTLLEKAVQSHRDMGLIKLSSETYRFYRNIPPSLRDVTIVFMSTQQEWDMLRRLGTILLFVGLAGLLIVFVSSLFLAGRALVPIKKSWEKQQNFVADASHELRTPLAVMQTNLELVLGNGEDTVESQAKWLENIQAESKRMTKLVNDLLFLARADSNQQLVEKIVFPLSKVIDGVAAAYEPLALKKGVRLGVRLSRDILFYGDEGKIKQLAVILLDNAIKYTSSEGTVTVLLNQYDNSVELIVKDTGEGIAKEHLKKIFDRFYRVDRARSRESGGTGLGLSIADSIVKEHKGTITVTSAPGCGSTFTVTLPILEHKR